MFPWAKPFGEASGITFRWSGLETPGRGVDTISCVAWMDPNERHSAVIGPDVGGLHGHRTVQQTISWLSQTPGAKLSGT